MHPPYATLTDDQGASTAFTSPTRPEMQGREKYKTGNPDPSLWNHKPSMTTSKLYRTSRNNIGTYICGLTRAVKHLKRVRTKFHIIHKTHEIYAKADIQIQVHCIQGRNVNTNTHTVDQQTHDSPTTSPTTSPPPISLPSTLLPSYPALSNISPRNAQAYLRAGAPSSVI